VIEAVAAEGKWRKERVLCGMVAGFQSTMERVDWE
jgi:hypothetical protein